MKKEKNMKIRKRLLITLVIGLVLVICFFLITSTVTKYTGFSVSEINEDESEKCLKNQDITLFINTDNPSEVLKKIGLDKYLSDLKIINCMRNNKDCSEREIGFFPTWIINNKIIAGDISSLELLEIAGCKN